MEHAGGEVRRGKGLEAGAGAFHPDVLRPVHHEFSHGSVVEQVVEAGEEPLEVGDADAHSWPASRARQ